jgi:hypothetical protein
MPKQTIALIVVLAVIVAWSLTMRCDSPETVKLGNIAVGQICK